VATLGHWHDALQVKGQLARQREQLEKFDQRLRRSALVHVVLAAIMQLTN
jgi:hypothetical protein